jgi:DNA replication protein DnaC
MEKIKPAVYRQPDVAHVGEMAMKDKPIVYAPRPMRAGSEQVCPRCHGDGWLRQDVPLGHPAFGKPVPCQCKTAEGLKGSLSRTYSWLGAGEDQVRELEAMTFASFDPTANGEQIALAYRRALHYAMSLQECTTGQKNALFVGPYGVGKTHLVCSILNALRAADIACLFVSGNDLFQALYASDFDERILRQAIETPLLCLDDLDKLQKKADGSYQKTILFTLLNQRHLARRPVILTANADDDWKAWLHEAVLSRLFGHVEAIGMKGQDHRMARVSGHN